MTIIDSHAHLLDEPGYLDQLLRTMDGCGVDQVCLSGLGPLFGHLDNAAVAAAVAAHPDRVIGQYFLRLGDESAEAVDRAVAQGFAMLKVTVPRKAYDEPEYHPIWERCLAYRWPILFHTGIVAGSAQGRGEGISSWAMHPLRVEPITREFPELRVILAHLGINHNRDAAELARLRPNVYVDLTGEPEGWRRRVDRVGFDAYLWWPGAWDKVVFGTDVHYSKIRRILDEDRQRMARYALPVATQAGILGGTMAALLGRAR